MPLLALAERTSIFSELRGWAVPHTIVAGSFTALAHTVLTVNACLNQIIRPAKAD